MSATAADKAPSAAPRKTPTKPRASTSAVPARKIPQTKPATAAAKPVKPAKVAVQASAEIPAKSPIKAEASKPAKIKLVRDSFTMPSDEYAALSELKLRALSFAHPAKKSELLRAGIKLLAGLGQVALLRALKDVPTIKTGRPKSKKSE